MNFHAWITLDHLGIPLPHGNGFIIVKNSYIKSTYYSISDDYGVNADEIWMARDWFYVTVYTLHNG